MTRTLLAAALAVATLTTATSSAFAADGWRHARRQDSYQAPVYNPQPTYNPRPTYQPANDYRPARSYRPADDYRPVQKPRSNYGD